MSRGGRVPWLEDAIGSSEAVYGMGDSGYSSSGLVIRDVEGFCEVWSDWDWKKLVMARVDIGSGGCSFSIKAWRYDGTSCSRSLISQRVVSNDSGDYEGVKLMSH